VPKDRLIAPSVQQPPAGVVRIDDPADPRLDDYRSLRDAELRKRYEGLAGVFIAEGPNVVRELLASRYPTRSLLVDPRRAEELAPAAAASGAPIYVAERELIYEVVAFRMHQGALACGQRVPPLQLDDVLPGARRVVLLDAMNDHENMGAVFRTARALGVDAVLLGPRSADPLYRRSVRVSMGHVLHVHHAPIGALPGALDDLRAAGLATVALTPDPAAPTIDAVDRARPLALLLGAEGPGLDPVTIAAADVRARIPMAPGVDSLNVAATAAIALHALRPDAR
jgi:tRNA G18 (ribose-2'-O)-methylase SpoU